jgi:Na+/H+-dicarboxylate symporter
MSVSLRIFAALLLGLATGAALTAGASEGVIAAATAIFDPVGTLWLSGLQMTVIPLVIGLLFTGIADAAGSAGASRLAGRALLLFTVLLIGTASFSVVFTPWLLEVWPASATAAAAIIGQSVVPAAAALDAGAWLKSFVPTNPFAALASGNTLQIVVFTAAAALATTRLPAAQRDTLVGIFDSITRAMIVLVQFVFWLGPIGVFALAALVGLRAGLDAIGVLAHYVLVVSFVQIIIIVGLYVLVAAARANVLRFARGIVPAQVVAVSTQSSIASLPAMLEAANGPLAIPERVTRLVLPLAVSVFRITSPVANLAVACYVAHLNGIELSAQAMATGVAVAFAVSIATIGLPGQVSFIASVAPICIAMGIPIAALPLLIAVEMLPDLFRTLGNVTADIAAATVLGKDTAAHESLDKLPG